MMGEINWTPFHGLRRDHSSHQATMAHDKPKVVLVPGPFQGHINPMLELAGLLQANGFSITVVHPELNCPDPAKIPYELVTIPDGRLSAFKASSDNGVLLVEALNANCQTPFRDALEQMLSADRQAIACVIFDALMYRMQAVADELGVATLAFRTVSAACFNMTTALPMLVEKGYLPAKDSDMESPVAELPPFRVKDLLFVNHIDVTKLIGVRDHILGSICSSSGLIINTFEAIEAAELETIGRELGVPVFSIGPLHKFSPSVQNSSIMAPDYSCMTWLDGQAPGSVLYVSFGSMVRVDKDVLTEMAWGLASSQQPFLWAVRPGFVRGAERIELPGEFLEETRGRGVVVEWAPQQEVLGHPAVGGFWTHNGWNSTIEGLCEGVPMLSSPYFSDQMANARYVSYVWKTGVTLENGIERREVAKAIKKLMREDEGEEMRARARALKEAASCCILTEGSSCASMVKLADHMRSIRHRKQ